MARPLKMGLDYFPLQTDIGSDPKIMRLIRRGGTVAWTVFTWMMILTYKDGYYSESEAIQEGIGWIFRELTDEQISEAFDILADIGLIDSTLYRKGIITSHGMQTQYDTVMGKRAGKPDLRYWILDGKTPVSESETPVSEAETSVSEAEMRQRETEREKEKENKWKEETETPVPLNDNYYSFSDEEQELLQALKDMGAKIASNTPSWVRKALQTYDKKSIREAIDITHQKQISGELKGSFVGYADKILENWSKGIGTPEHIKRMEQELEAKKREYMKPGKIQFMKGEKR